MILWGGLSASLELRAEGGETRLRASFPYNNATTIAGPGRSGLQREETFAARAFAARIESGEDVHFLSGHDFNKPLASRAAGTLTLRETDDALTIEATISRDMQDVSYVRDFLAANAAGLIRGISPGFRVRPGGESVEQRGATVLRTVKDADLFEISAVTRPAYPRAQIEARDWSTTPVMRRINLIYNNTNRWR